MMLRAGEQVFLLYSVPKEASASGGKGRYVVSCDGGSGSLGSAPLCVICCRDGVAMNDEALCLQESCDSCRYP